MLGKLKMTITVHLCKENCRQHGTYASNVKPLVSKIKARLHMPLCLTEKGHNKGAPYTTYAYQSASE